MFIGVVEGALAALGKQNDTDSQHAHSASSVDRFCRTMTDKPSSKRPQDKAARTRQAADGAGTKMNPAFDTWLEEKLHNMFDAVAAEPLPADLLKLLDDLDKKTSETSSDDKKSGK
jgi:hypothetical protein